MSSTPEFELGDYLKPGERFTFEPPKFHIEGLLPDRGVCLVTGAPNVGKSTWILWLLFQLQGGIFERDDGAEGWWGVNSLFIALEGQDQLKEAWYSFANATPEHQLIEGIHRHRNRVAIATPTGFNITDIEHVEALKREVSSADREMAEFFYNGGKNHIVVLDSLSGALRGQDENSAAVMSAAAAGLQHLAGGTWQDDDGEVRGGDSKCLVIVLHHPTKNSNDPRGSGALVAGTDCALHISQQGEVLTVKNTRARGFARGAKRRYTRRIEAWCDLAKADSPDFSRVEFDEIPDAPAPTKAAPTATFAAPAARAAEPPPRAAEPAPAPKPPAHPAERLKGRAAACWAALELPPGGAMGLEEAKAFCTQHPAFADVPKDRVGDRWKAVVSALENKGLVKNGAVVNPAD